MVYTIGYLKSMKINHLIIEGYCEEVIDKSLPCSGDLILSIECFKCPKFSYTIAPNEIAYSNENSIAEKWIGFGGEMEPVDETKMEGHLNLWERICKEKIKEALNDYDNKKEYL